MQGQQNVQTPADGRTTGADEERARRAGAPGADPKKKTAEVIRHRPKRRARGSQPAKISELHLHPTGPGCHKTQRERSSAAPAGASSDGEIRMTTSSVCP